MKRICLNIILLLTGVMASCGQPAPSTPPDSPKPSYRLCNPNATAEAQKVFEVLSRLYGEKIISGTVALVDWNTTEAEHVYEWTGRYPALNGFDFINIANSKDVNPSGWLDYSDISVVEAWWRAGGLVSGMWHWQMPTNSGNGMTCTPGSGAQETAFDCSKISDKQSSEYKRVVQDIDQVAGYLKKMQRQGIPVLWRPLHEAAGNTYEFDSGKAWFWWGAQGAEAYIALWRLMYDRLVNYHGLNNLIWVWTAQTGDHSWYPGDEYVDIVGRDNYYALQYPLAKEYKALSEQYPDKMITLAECGNGDQVDMSLLSDIWAEGGKWSWFMTWYDYSYQQGSTRHRYADRAWWTEAFSQPYVVTREQMKELLEQ